MAQSVTEHVNLKIPALVPNMLIILHRAQSKDAGRRHSNRRSTILTMLDFAHLTFPAGDGDAGKEVDEGEREEMVELAARDEDEIAAVRIGV